MQLLRKEIVCAAHRQQAEQVVADSTTRGYSLFDILIIAQTTLTFQGSTRNLFGQAQSAARAEEALLIQDACP